MSSSSATSPSDTASPPEAHAAPVIAYEIPTDPNAANAEKPYHAKRPHKKSRSGCKNCKARKVKCDEARPTCRSCRLRKTECVYPAATHGQALHAPIVTQAIAATDHSPTYPSFNRSSTTATTSSSSTSPPSVVPSLELPYTDPISQQQQLLGYSPVPEGEPLAYPSYTEDDVLGAINDNQSMVISEPLYRPPPAIDDLDMRLLWFYTTATCSAFSVECGTDRPVENIMRTKLVQHAFGTPFLMDTLFALSSMHLQNLGQDVESHRALTYRAKAYHGYRRAVEGGREEDFPGLMANSLLLTALSSQNFRDPEGKPLYLTDWMIVWRGIGLMIKMMGVKKLTDSGLATLFYRPPMDLEKATLDIPNNLLFMITSIPPDDIDYPEMDTYYNTLKYLGTLYMYLRKEGLGPIQKLRIITWFTFIPPRFVELAQEKRPRVLVILAHYAIFLKLCVSVWWLRGVGQRTLLDINLHLGGSPHFADTMRIPLMATGVDGEDELSRLVLQNPDWISPLRLSAGELALDPKTQESIHALTWVDNTGRKVMVRNDEMVLVDRSVGPSEPVWVP